ncbi:MAG: hypothetical protein LBJ00_13955 [Planctomycetaceae bacterium]|nr:hypothetical protein [Planctomycetaceae bacterium]
MWASHTVAGRGDRLRPYRFRYKKRRPARDGMRGLFKRLNCNHIASHTGRGIFFTLFSTNILSLTGRDHRLLITDHQPHNLAPCGALCFWGIRSGGALHRQLCTSRPMRGYGK